MVFSFLLSEVHSGPVACFLDTSPVLFSRFFLSLENFIHVYNETWSYTCPLSALPALPISSSVLSPRLLCFVFYVVSLVCFYNLVSLPSAAHIASAWEHPPENRNLLMVIAPKKNDSPSPNSLLLSKRWGLEIISPIYRGIWVSWLQVTPSGCEIRSAGARAYPEDNAPQHSCPPSASYVIPSNSMRAP